jgi:hypothetical protein
MFEEFTRRESAFYKELRQLEYLYRYFGVNDIARVL